MLGKDSFEKIIVENRGVRRVWLSLINKKKGDKVAIVSLSWGGLGDKELIHKYYIAKERLERDFGLEVVIMPHAFKGSDFV